MRTTLTSEQCIRSWDSESKSRLLQYATGTSRIPVNGFKDLQGSDGPRRFTIEKAGDITHLPKAHTWYGFSPILSTWLRADKFVASIVLIYLPTNRTKSCRRSSHGLWRKQSVLVRNKPVVGSRRPFMSKSSRLVVQHYERLGGRRATDGKRVTGKPIVDDMTRRENWATEVNGKSITRREESLRVQRDT